MSETIIYICSQARSGSTLLDQLLGGHSDICTVGEVIHLNAYALNDRTYYDPVHELLCSCGHDVNHCAFWSGVERTMGTQMSSLQMNPYTMRNFKPLRYQVFRDNYFARQIEDRPQLINNPFMRWISGGARIGADGTKLFRAIGEVSQRRFIVDSSKSVFRFLSLYKRIPRQLKLVLLVRDYRGVTFSGMQRGRSLTQSVTSWTKKLRQMEAMSSLVPDAMVLRVKYEDLCQDPDRTMRRLCEFVGVEYDAAILDRKLDGLHHIGGSPSKFSEDHRAIRLDTRYQTAFSDDELGAMRKIVGPEAEKWGYT